MPHQYDHKLDWSKQWKKVKVIEKCYSQIWQSRLWVNAKQYLGSFLWSGGQHPRLPLRQSEFEVCWLLNLYNKTKINEKEAWVGPSLKRYQLLCDVWNSTWTIFEWKWKIRRFGKIWNSLVILNQNFYYNLKLYFEWSPSPRLQQRCTFSQFKTEFIHCKIS